MGFVDRPLTGELGAPAAFTASSIELPLSRMARNAATRSSLPATQHGQSVIFPDQGRHIHRLNPPSPPNESSVGRRNIQSRPNSLLTIGPTVTNPSGDIIWT